MKSNDALFAKTQHDFLIPNPKRRVSLVSLVNVALSDCI